VIPELKTISIAMPDPTKFAERDPTLLSTPVNPRVKLRQNGIVSFPIRLDAFQARGGARMKLHGMTNDD